MTRTYYVRVDGPVLRFEVGHYDKDHRIRIVQQKATHGRVLFRSAPIHVEHCLFDGRGADGVLMSVEAM